ncbi:MAG: Gfo/Idh/MocA family oxidoreductase [Phycisphaerae bacterium]|nr:Gfo/Idh/MocA family oxidoreductase [Phycisphaerae bacterium]
MQRGKSQELSRRDFVKGAATAAAVVSSFPFVARGAAADRPLRVGLVGCGGRGSGAAHDVLAAAPKVQIIALADVFKDRLDSCRAGLKDKAHMEVPEKNCFVGFDAYKKLVAMDEVDYVILATPPYYRPAQLTACIDAGKHVFMEKPVAVDPVGIRRIIAAGEKAASKNLSIVAGTQRRHQKSYIETIRRIQDGAIGDLVGGQVYWNGGALWYRKREAGWADMDWMIRDWVNWCWLSGDHIVEQHVHNIDVWNWAFGKPPESVVAMGSRLRRKTGDQFDNFAADFTYPGDVHVMSMCRQINGCDSNVSERIIGQKGISNCNGFISTVGKIEVDSPHPYVQEHADLIQAIRTGKPVNEARQVAESTLCAIMARTSAYTGKPVTWEEIMKSDEEFGPPDYELTEENVRAHVPVPGTVQG